MGFFSRAWDSAGHEYGRQNAQRYARLARIRNWVGMLTLALFLIYCYHLGSGTPAPEVPPQPIPYPSAR